MRSLMTVAAGLVAGVFLAGCGGGSSSTADAPDKTASSPSASASASASSAPTRTKTIPAKVALRANVQAYSDAFLTGDAVRAYALLSRRCQLRTSLSSFTGLVTAARRTYGSALPIKTFKATIHGPQARVTYSYSVAAINQTQEPWAKEGGLWYEDDC